MKLDILAFAAHPDDVELACSGTLIKHVKAGKTVGIIDLTMGELGTRGTPEIRAREALKAAEILKLSARENLNLGDGFFENNREAKLSVIKMIRKYQPEIVLANSIRDRHPDHGRAAKIVSEACFLSGLIKIETDLEGQKQPAWRPKTVYHFIQDRYIKPDVVIDISDVMEQKLEAIKAFSSQFYNPDSQEPVTPISTPEFMEFLRARSITFGREIGVTYGEGFTAERQIGIKDFFDLI